MSLISCLARRLRRVKVSFKNILLYLDDIMIASGNIFPDGEFAKSLDDDTIQSIRTLRDLLEYSVQHRRECSFNIILKDDSITSSDGRLSIIVRDAYIDIVLVGSSNCVNPAPVDDYTEGIVLVSHTHTCLIAIISRKDKVFYERYYLQNIGNYYFIPIMIVAARCEGSALAPSMLCRGIELLPPKQALREYDKEVAIPIKYGGLYLASLFNALSIENYGRILYSVSGKVPIPIKPKCHIEEVPVCYSYRSK